MFSKKTQYGLAAVIYLAKNYSAGPILITRLAKEERIPKKFLEAILLELKKEGLLKSIKGKGGGYLLNKAPQEIKIGDVTRVLDGPIGEISFHKSKEESEIEKIIKEVRDAMSNILDKTTVQDVIDRTNAGSDILNFMI